MTVTLPGNTRGRVLSIGSAIDPETRSVLVKASIGAAPGLIAGKSVMASILADAGNNAIAVPASAVTRLDGADVVFIRTAKGFEKRVVAVGGSAEGITVIVEGLAAGEVIAISGLTEIKMTLGGE